MKTLRFEKKENPLSEEYTVGNFRKIYKDLPSGMYELRIVRPVITPRQSRALHLFFGNVARALNESGNYFNKDFFKSGWEREWTGEMVKELIWRPIQQAYTQQTSTTKISTTQVTEIAEQIKRGLAHKGIIIDFPSIDAILLNLPDYEII